MNELINLTKELAVKSDRPTQLEINFESNGNLLVSLHCVQDGKAVQYIDTVEGLTERLQGILKPKMGFFAGYE